MAFTILLPDTWHTNLSWHTEMVVSCLLAKALEASRECRLLYLVSGIEKPLMYAKRHESVHSLRGELKASSDGNEREQK
ncbi:hypothetical protein [Hydrococcus rivularis]|uniref:hypothetical protein n=1 Tax=Hydrococcus rivularis TaxID=1616834 RepID=UPI0015882322|nr:hypothetical protein [Hydrococcus rivularis]